MKKEIKATLPQGFEQFTQEQKHFDPSEQSVRNYTFPNLQKSTDSSQNFDQLEQTNKQCQNQPLTIDKQDLRARKQRARVLRERAGLLVDQPARKPKRQHKKWGNFVVIHDGNFSITLGPDYWCFIPTFICFTIVSITILTLIFQNTQSVIVKSCAVFVCCGQLFAYMLIATSNPGIAKQENDYLSFAEYESPQKAQPRKMCSKCGFSVPRSSYHCRDCDVCILGYDHHCPWTSKCIGKNNLCRFYFFLAMTPIFLVFVAVAFVIIMSEEASMMGRKNIRKLFEFSPFQQNF